MTDSTTDTPQRQAARYNRTGCLVGCLAAPVIIVLLGGLAVVAWWHAARYSAAQDLAAEIEKVRARGEPLTTVELDAYYVPAPGRPDMTQEIMAALALCDSAELKLLAKDLPIVGPDAPAIPDPPQTWDQLEAVEAFLAKQQPALDTFYDVARREGTARYPTDWSIGISAKLDHIPSLRNAVRVLALQFYVDLHRGRPHEAVESLLAILALTRTLDQDPCLVSQMLRLALTGVVVKMYAIAILRTTHASNEDLARLQEGLRKTQFAPGLHQAFAGELTHGYTACIDPLLWAHDKPAPTPERMRQVVKRPPQRIHDAAMIVRIHNRMIAATDNGLEQSLHVADDIEVELKELQHDRTKLFLYMITFLHVPACRAAVEASARAQAECDSLDCAIAAELYRRRHGEWPSKLDELVPEFLPVVPSDPFSGSPLLLKITDSELKVYSVGMNRQDDGGVFTDGKGPDFGFAIPLKAAESP